MLHVLNGDATATVFAAAGLPGDVLVWRDILVEGPLTAEWTAPTALAARAAYLATRLAIDPERYLSGVRAQEEGLAGALRHDEVVLWFEQDLFCAVNLWYLLTWFSRRPSAARLMLVYPPTDAGERARRAHAGAVGYALHRAPARDDARAGSRPARVGGLHRCRSR